MNWEPHNYQLKAMQLMLSQSSLGLFLDPGLGKTSTWLGAFTTLKEMGYVEKMLVIAPLLPMYGTWPKEIDKFDDFNHLTWAFLHGPDKEEMLNVEADIYLINPEGVGWLTDRVDPSKLADVLCVDESTKFKNSTSKRFKAMRPFWHRFDRRWIGTGTPSPNGLEDLFGQIYILDAGHALGKYVTHFRRKWFYTEPWAQYTYIPHEHAFEEITTAIAPLCLQMSADDYLEMPTLMQIDKKFELPPEARRVYDELDSEFISVYDSTQDALLAPTQAAAGGKCRQICNGAVYVEEGSKKFTELHSEKLDLLDELLDEIGEHPVLVVYEFQHDKTRIARRHLNWPDITGMTGPCLERMQDMFNEGKIPRMLIQSSKAHGLNIQAACHHIVFFGLTWDWENYKQMLDRLYRQGQSSNIVMAYRLLAANTYDEVVAGRLKEKAQQEYGVKKAIDRYRRDS